MRSARGAALAAAILLVGWALVVGPAGGQYDPQDEWQGLPPGEGREEVFYNCVACHSMAIIMQQRLSRRVWDEVLDWMVEEMNMPELGEQDRRRVLDYLTQHFGQDVPR